MGSGPLALLAGAGDLPEEARRTRVQAGDAVHVIAFEGVSDGSLAEDAPRERLGRLDRLVERLREVDARRVLVVGRFDRGLLVPGGPIDPDERARALLGRLAGRSDVSVMGLVAEWLEETGFRLERQDLLLAALLAPAGPIAGGRGAVGDDDVAIGREAITRLAARGAGQAVAIRGGQVVAEEGPDGTDAMIRRAGAGATIVKAARPDQDRRLDLPTIGPGTIGSMARSGAVALSVEAGSTLVVERARLAALAARAGITVSGHRADPAAWERAS